MKADRKAVALIVDDDEFYRKSLQESFSEAGFRCLIAANGEEGLELYRKIRPDLVILDRIMPKAGGTRFLMGVGEKPNRREAFLVVYSSTLREKENSSMKDALATPGFSRVLEVPKTVSPKDLGARMKALFFPAA